MSSDPFTPAVPRNGEHGRMLTHRQLRPDWLCRWCRNHLTASAAGPLVCMNCDFPNPSGWGP